MGILKNRLIYYLGIALLVGILLGVFGSNYFSHQNSNNQPQDIASEFHSGNTAYKFINPLYECNTGQKYGTSELSVLGSNIDTYINQLKANNTVTSVAVYYRDLNNGPWFGVNEHDDFAPSSLLKLPVMMAYFKAAEKDPTILDKKIAYTTDPVGVIPENFPPAHPLEKGKTYTVEQLIEQMITASDNVALRLLEDNIDNNKIDQVTLDLGITTATASTPEDFMDVQEYSTLFRVLYYSTYLNKDYSEKALTILSKAEFANGLTQLLPKNLIVAHKFGERDLPNGTHQLHDCGIAYYPKHPYLICIMTKGPDFNDLSTSIEQISSKIYSDLLNRYH
jgi:beta-lactamase class A